MRYQAPFFARLVAVAMSATPASADVLVVDAAGGPGSQFTKVNPAVQAAAEGDVIVVRSGNYDLPAYLGSKSLTIQADGAAYFFDMYWGSGGGIVVSNLPAGKRIVLRGLRFLGLFDFAVQTDATSMSAKDCVGSLWIDSCTSNSQIVLKNCANVVVTNSSLQGGDNSGPPSLPIPAIDSVSSNIYLHDTTLIGGNGHGASSSLPLFASVDGAAAVRMVGGTALLSNCSASGGKGGNGYLNSFGGCLSAGLGGPALHLASGNPTVTSIDCVFTIGKTGATPGGCSPPTGTVAAVDVDSGTWTPWAGAPGGFTASSPVRGQQSLQLTFQDVAGSSALVLLSADAASALTPQFSGALHLGSPLLVTGLGSIPAEGTLTLPIVVPPLPAGVLSVVVYLQGATCPPTTPCTLGPPSTVVVLDSTL